MTTANFRILATLSLAATSLVAQSKPLIKVNVPFNFVTGARTFPAGEYRVQQLAPSALAIQSAGGHIEMAFTTHGGARNHTPGVAKLTFNRYGDRYFLSKVSNNDHGWELATSAAEKELIAKKGEPKPVSIVASSSQ